MSLYRVNTIHSTHYLLCNSVALLLWLWITWHFVHKAPSFDWQLDDLLPPAKTLLEESVMILSEDIQVGSELKKKLATIYPEPSAWPQANCLLSTFSWLPIKFTQLSHDSSFMEPVLNNVSSGNFFYRKPTIGKQYWGEQWHVLSPKRIEKFPLLQNWTWPKTKIIHYFKLNDQISCSETSFYMQVT